MGILSYCKVVTKIKPLNKDGTQGTEASVPYYFQGSSAYADPTFATTTGIELIPNDKWDASHPLVPVAQLIESNILNRLSVVVLGADKKKKRYDVVVNQELVSVIIDGTAAQRLDGKSFKLLSKTGSSVEKGKVVRVGGKTSQYNP